MEPFLADLVNNPKVPKIIRYIIVSVISLFILFVGIICVFNSVMIFGKILGVVICILILVLSVYLLRKIHKS